MSEFAARNWRMYVDDMIRFSERAMAYTNGMSRTVFEEETVVYDATLRNLELIGEAATHIPESIRLVFTSIPWRQIIATRNRLIHGYLGIDNDTVWSIIKNDLPGLLAALRSIPADVE